MDASKRAALMCSVICVCVSAHMLIIAIHSDSQAQTFKRLERKKNVIDSTAPTTHAVNSFIIPMKITMFVSMHIKA